MYNKYETVGGVILIQIHEILAGTDVDICIKTNSCILWDDSGTGKTFFIEILYNWLLIKQYKVYLFNSKNYEVSDKVFKSIVNETDILLCDNADLYLTKEKVNYIRSNTDLFIISVKNFYSIGVMTDNFYAVYYDQGILRLKESHI